VHSWRGIDGNCGQRLTYNFELCGEVNFNATELGFNHASERFHRRVDHEVNGFNLGMGALPAIEHRARGSLGRAADPNCNLTLFPNSRQPLRHQGRHEIALLQMRYDVGHDRHRQLEDPHLGARDQLTSPLLRLQNVFYSFGLCMGGARGPAVEISTPLQLFRLALRGLQDSGRLRQQLAQLTGLAPGAPGYALSGHRCEEGC
jgi:hypothetical protein